ncbi:MAG: DNA-binding protein WhiA [Thermincola sp.]|jgi:DNA-binding protein WhiA|nr:DNA-binding protein WhiA [Thermincola sp.]MDT3704711.1 DNA-binding protein WhiA [Thermincola sp.]
MSYSIDTKNELARIVAAKTCCQLAELAAIVKMDGIMQLSGKHEISLNIMTENAAVARKVFTYLKNLFGVPTDIMMTKKNRLKKNNVYLVRMSPQAEVINVLGSIGMIDEQGGLPGLIKPELLKKDCCRRAYLRGVFLGGGSVSDPEGDYHLEILVNDENFSRFLCRLLKRYSLTARINERKNWDVVYLKGGEDIIKLLNLMGAHQALLSFENIRIYKDVRNQVNRLVNCETANLNKTVNAAVQQIEDIKLLDEAVGLAKLPLPLRSVAEIRLKYPDISLKELGEKLDPPIGKSGVNHRIRRLQKMADKIKEKH